MEYPYNPNAEFNRRADAIDARREASDPLKAAISRAVRAGFRQECRNCIIGDPCERHRRVESDEPTREDIAAMRFAAGMIPVCDEMALKGAVSRRQGELSGVEAPGY